MSDHPTAPRHADAAIALHDRLLATPGRRQDARDAGERPHVEPALRQPLRRDRAAVDPGGAG